MLQYIYILLEGVCSGWGTLPYVDRYHLPVLWPPLFPKSYTQGPRSFPTVHTSWSLFFSKFQLKASGFSRTSRAFSKFCQFSAEKGDFFAQIWQNVHQMTPYLGSLHQKGPFFRSHTQWPPFFYEILHRIHPCFHSPVSTYPSFSYSYATRVLLIPIEIGIMS